MNTKETLCNFGETVSGNIQELAGSSLEQLVRNTVLRPPSYWIGVVSHRMYNAGLVAASPKCVTVNLHHYAECNLGIGLCTILLEQR